MTDLYHDLGVDPDADPEEIRKAYLRKAKKHHPDSGDGDREQFDKAKNASIVLLDPVRRAKYDETGDDGTDPDDSMSMLASMMAQALEAAMSRVQGQFQTSDIVDEMTRWARQKRQDINGEIAKGEKATIRYEAMLKRVKHKGQGQDLLSNILRDRKRDLGRNIAALEKSRDGFSTLIDALDAYEWETDQVSDLHMMLAGFPSDIRRAGPWHDGGPVGGRQEEE